MLMICWFYCGPFVTMMYFASAPLLALFALFMLRRGVVRGDAVMRARAFFLMFAAAVKIFIFDLQELQGVMFCRSAFAQMLPLCNRPAFVLYGLLRIAALLGACALIFHYYRQFLHCRTHLRQSPQKLNMRGWANASFLGVMGLAGWTMLPWVGTLTTGKVPALFNAVSWQTLAVLSGGILLATFWRSESCDWTPARRHGQLRGLTAEAAATWSPRDTLWTSAFLYVVTLALAYVTHDVLT